jgi:hypothetical protein
MNDYEITWVEVYETFDRHADKKLVTYSGREQQAVHRAYTAADAVVQFELERPGYVKSKVVGIRPNIRLRADLVDARNLNAKLQSMWSAVCQKVDDIRKAVS